MYVSKTEHYVQMAVVKIREFVIVNLRNPKLTVRPAEFLHFQESLLCIR